jgi:hypothetical protein
MLELALLRSQIEEMGEEKIGSEDRLTASLKRAIHELSTAETESLRERIRMSKTSWLVAEPLEKLSLAREAPAPPNEFTVVAADGSQIMPSRQEVAYCYLINIGSVAIHYGLGRRPVLKSMPRLYYRDEDMHEELDGKETFINEEMVSARRDLEELDELVRSARSLGGGRNRVVALVDGTLIKWILESYPPDFRDRFLGRFLQGLDALKEAGIPIAGYISHPGSRDVVNALKVGLCYMDGALCARCERNPPPCAMVDGVSDRMLMGWLLKKEGERSCISGSSAVVLEDYGEHRVFFFYLQTGGEIARVEVPRWVVEDKGMLDLVHSVVADQAKKGSGYPVALTEAHEKAVVRGKDRELFFQIVEEVLIKKGLKTTISVKSMSKRRPTV